MILGIIVGPRTSQTIALTASIVMGVPCYFSDGFSCFTMHCLPTTIKSKCFLNWKTRTPQRSCKRTSSRSRICSGSKRKEKRQIGRYQSSHQMGAERLAKLGFNIGTSFLERLNLTIRQSLAPFVKLASAKKRAFFFFIFYNFARPHMISEKKYRIPMNDFTSWDN